MRIAIIGTGRAGTSLGLAIRAQSKAPKIELWGYDSERLHADRARAVNAIDRSQASLKAAVEGADLVVLAIPLAALEDTLKQIGVSLRPDCVVTDMAHLKAPVLAWADRYLPEHVHFVGGHPLLGPPPAGEPGAGPEAARADLFKGVPYCLVPGARANEDALKLVGDLATLIGAHPYFVDAAEHDGGSMAVNVLPALTGAALLRVTAGAGSWRESRRLAGQAYADVTAAADAWRDVLALEQQSVLPWMDTLIAELELIRELIARGEAETLAARVDAAKAQRAVWLNDWIKGNWPDISPPDQERPPDLGDMFSRVLFGGLAAERRRRDDKG
jgi:prephenate dehydrogenase